MVCRDFSIVFLKVFMIRMICGLAVCSFIGSVTMMCHKNEALF